AYIADLTEPEERAKYYGWVGAVSGFGFVVGPAIGGLLSRISYEAPFYAVAAITVANTLWGIVQLPESLAKENRAPAIDIKRLNPFSQLWDAFQNISLRWLLVATFLVAFAFAVLQSNLAVLVQAVLHWNPDGVSSVFFVVGTVGVIMQ